MPISPDVMKAFLIVCQLCMAALAVGYIHKRALSLPAFIGWGLFAFLVPFLGPFLVILARPGEKQSGKR